jgi:hypothetical protein
VPRRICWTTDAFEEREPPDDDERALVRPPGDRGPAEEGDVEGDDADGRPDDGEEAVREELPAVLHAEGEGDAELDEEEAQVAQGRLRGRAIVGWCSFSAPHFDRPPRDCARIRSILSPGTRS